MTTIIITISCDVVAVLAVHGVMDGWINISIYK